MILEALVKTVEAIDPTVCVDALASPRIVNRSRFSASISSADKSSPASCSRLRPLTQNVHTRNVIIPMATTPPITPPAIAPVFDFDPPDDGEGVLDELPARPPLIQEVDGHAAQD